MFHVEQFELRVTLELRGWVSAADHDESAPGFWNVSGRHPNPARGVRKLDRVVVPDPQDHAAVRGQRALRERQKCSKAADRARRDKISEPRLKIEFFVATISNSDAIQAERPKDFRKEGALLLIRFNQNDLQVRPEDFERQSGESSAGSEVGEPTISKVLEASGEHGFAEVAGDHFNGVDNSCKAKLLIPFD